jgi:hypothetical protein
LYVRLIQGHPQLLVAQLVAVFLMAALVELMSQKEQPPLLAHLLPDEQHQTF